MFDLAVIGLGPGGIEAVNIAIKNNLKVVAFEKANIGGCCLNVGCIPTKTILHSAKTLNDFSKLNSIGLDVACPITFDWQKILDRKNDIVSKFKKATENILSKNIDLIKEEAQLFVENGEIKIKADNEIYCAKNIIISTGSTARELPNLKFNGDNILSSDDLYNLKKLPNSIAIVGSGAIGLEWGYILSSFGVKTTIIEKMPSLCPNMDIEVSKRIERILKQNKIDYFKDDFIVLYNNDNVVLNSNKEIEAEKILVAVGRKPLYPVVSKDIILKTEKRFETNFDNLFVIGDVTGIGMLAHSASDDARNVINKILFNKPYKNKLIPSVIYIHPEIATVGIKEQDIDETYLIKKLPVAAIAKSWADNSSDGFIKLIIKDNLIKGASVISNEASSLVSILSLIIEHEIKIDEVENFIFPHPSYSELISEVIKRG